MKSWLDILQESTQESEAPERYFWWAGLAAISAVVGKKIFIDRVFYKLYPNIFVALVSAKSGLRKGIPISICKSLVESLDSIRVISGCNSIQGLIMELSQQKTFKSGAVVNEAQGMLVSDEFESFLVDDPKALTYLTALHNTHEHENGWDKRLKSSPLEQLKSPCLTLLIASNEALFESMIKKKDMEGGFIARTFIIHESKRRAVNSLMYTKEESTILKDRNNKFKAILSERLKKIHTLEGEVEITTDARLYYDSWYKDLSKSEVEDNTGSLERLGDQVLKCAMLVGVSSHDELQITKEDLIIAIEESERCILGVKEISMEKQEGEINPIIESILKVFLKSPDQEVTRQKLLQDTHIESLLIDRAMQTLIERGAISDPYRNIKKQIAYKMNREVFERYTQFKVMEAKVN